MANAVDCLGSIPYASVIAFILVFVGSGIMAGTLWEAVSRVDRFFVNNFFKVQEFEYAQYGGVVIACIIVLLAILMLVFSSLATGATRGKIYRGDRCIMGGRCSAGFFITLAYLANVFYIGVASLLVVPLVGWLMLSRMCFYELAYWKLLNTQNKAIENFSKVFNLTNYGIYAEVYTKQHHLLKWNETITQSTQFSLMCNQVYQTGPLFLCSFGGAVFVIFGLVTFMGAVAANYTHLKYTSELTEYRREVDQQTDFAYVDSYNKPLTSTSNSFV